MDPLGGKGAPQPAGRPTEKGQLKLINPRDSGGKWRDLPESRPRGPAEGSRRTCIPTTQYTTPDLLSSFRLVLAQRQACPPTTRQGRHIPPPKQAQAVLRGGHRGTLGSRKTSGRTTSVHPAPQQRLTPRAALTRIPPQTGDPSSSSRHTLSSQQVAHSHPIPQKRLTPRAALERLSPLVCYLPTTSPNDLEPQPDAQKSA